MAGNGASGAIEALARAGYAARGVVYLLVGGLAVAAALGPSGETTGTRGALRELLSQPFGETLLGLIALGLVGYAVWRFVQAAWDTDHHGLDAKGLAVRAALVVSAVLHVSLAVFAVRLIGGGTGGGGDSEQTWTAWLLQQDYGQALVIGVGLCVLGAGVAHAVKGAKAGFEKHMVMDPGTRRWAVPVSRFGLVARGVVFFMIGCFFLVAAVQFDSAEAGGLAGALSELQQQPYGAWLLGLVALGLVAFGVYSLLEARYRRVQPPGDSVGAHRAASAAWSR